MKVQEKPVYPQDWAKIQFYLELNADLYPVNMNIFHRTSIDERCLRRKKKFAQLLEGNIDKLSVFFGTTQRHEHLVFQGRRMYRQYTETLQATRKQITHIETWLNQSTPF